MRTRARTAMHTLVVIASIAITGAYVVSCNLDSSLPDNNSDGGGDAPSSCPTCQLLAMRPPIAETGDMLTLEGTFEEPTSVTFPGGEIASATVTSGPPVR